QFAAPCTFPGPRPPSRCSRLTNRDVPLRWPPAAPRRFCRLFLRQRPRGLLHSEESPLTGSVVRSRSERPPLAPRADYTTLPHAPRFAVDTDRNILFGVLALRAGLLDADQFAAACDRWAGQQSKTLADLLAQSGGVSAEDRPHLDYLFDRHLRQHGS